MNTLAHLLLFVVALVALPPAALAQGGLVDLDGRPVDPFAGPANVRADAFIFTTTDCPIANRYAPEIARLHKKFSPQGIRFWLVYANPAEPVAKIRMHAQRFGYPMTPLRDLQHDLVKRLGVTVTPETAVIDRNGRTLYRGRIDDRYVDFGVERPSPTRRDLDEALNAIVQGHAVATAETRAVGCIVADFEPVTFAKDIAPIMFDKCASCHRPNGAAPFNLLTYRDVRMRAAQIATVTRSRFMPPWKADSDAGGFVGQQRLSDAEIGLIRRWVDEGAVEGDSREMPHPPTFADGWQLGTPDLVVMPSEPYTLQAEASDVFRIFVIRVPVNTTKYVRGIEFHPGNARVVHHANIRLDHTSTSRELDARDPAPGYDGLMARSAVYPEGHFLGWTPGQVAPLVPGNMAWRLDPGTDLVLQLHMQPSGAIETVQPSIGIFFGTEAATRTPTILRLGSQGIDIPPGEPRYTVTDSYVLPVDVELHAIQPHAHYRLRDVRGSATLPDGTTRSLIRIAEWDFRWQHVYRYVTPLRLPKGTRLAMHYVYDNSSDNPRNPQLPPQRVLWGQRSIDEMGDLWFQFVTANESDRLALTRPIEQKMATEDLIGYETMLRANPNDVELHDDAAVLSLSLGRATDAVAHFQAAAALKPTPAAHFNLGTALSVAGRLAEAIVEYRKALMLRPDYANAHNNLGSVLAATGIRDEAVKHFREAVRLDASNVQAHRNLAWHLAVVRDTQVGGADEAVRAAERAAQLTDHKDAQVLDTLAIAYAAASRFDQAIATAQRALSLTSDASLQRGISERLALYREQRPYRLP